MTSRVACGLMGKAEEEEEEEAAAADDWEAKRSEGLAA
jgi:hypothetical protein